MNVCAELWHNMNILYAADTLRDKIELPEWSLGKAYSSKSTNTEFQYNKKIQ